MESLNESEQSLVKIWQTWRVPVLIGILSLFLIITSIILLVKSSGSTSPIEFSSDKASSQASESAKTTSLIAVDVEGAVVNPGLYQLATGSRIEEAIGAAGGLSNEADQQRISQSINRAAKLSDGAKLYIPKISDTTQAVSNQNIAGANTDLININSASIAELDSLSGIGPVTAQKIIDNRPYQTLEELVAKKTVGSSLFEKIKDKLTL